uniref:Uncharacterized protein n=1 Tax=Arundo donax TaxID=35708 RepID=A0A0A9DKI1_ARUDO
MLFCGKCKIVVLLISSANFSGYISISVDGCGNNTLLGPVLCIFWWQHAWELNKPFQFLWFLQFCF